MLFFFYLYPTHRNLHLQTHSFPARRSSNLVLTIRIMRPPHKERAAKNTRHSNNQNSINARDLQSNSTIQRRLQTEFRANFTNQIDYEIKRGEALSAPLIITNEEAARLLLAFD